MTPEAQDYLAKAREHLADARKIMGIGLGRVAARGAYYAAFHATEALLIERTGKVAKTHSGLRSTLSQLLKDEPGTNRDLLTFPARAYRYKERSDYVVGLLDAVTVAEARDMIEGSTHFLDRITTMLGGSTEH